ncbi:hypothetical protein L7F22_036920 [Adiantum nelumboides]|nr:hypothetical protein [Adiantum nelumboides]
MWEETEAARKKEAEDEAKRVKAAQEAAFGPSSSSKSQPVSPPADHSSPSPVRSPPPPPKKPEEETTSAPQDLILEKKLPFVNQPKTPTPLFSRITIIELPKEKKRAKAPEPKKNPEVVGQNIFSTQPNIFFILEQLEVPMPTPSSSSSDKSYDIIELESGNLELHEVQKPPQVPSPTTELPSTKVVKDNKESEADTTIQEEIAQEVEATYKEIVKETTQELQGELIKSPVKDVEAALEIEVEKVQPTSAAATTQVAAQQPKEYVFGEELLDEVYWLKKLIDLRMKESTPMSNHLNEFYTIVSQLQSQGVEFDDFVRTMFLLVTLPDLWDTFRTTVSNFAARDGLECADVESSLLMEEVNCKNVEDTKSFHAMHVRGKSRSRGYYERRDKSKSRSRSKSRPGKGVECYYCHKKCHMKKDCYKFKRDKKKDSDDKRKSKNANDDREANTLTSDKGKCIVDSEEPKALTHDSDGDICYASNLCPTLLVATNSSYEQDWIVDSRASFHVTPHKEWFSSYESRCGTVRLGNSYACDIVGAGDIRLSLPNGSIFTLTNVRHVSKLTKILISTG